MILKQFLEKNAWAIMILVGSTTLSATMLYLNSIHSMKGEAEANILKFEIQKQEAYELVDPGSRMSEARKMIIRQAQSQISAYESQQ